MKPENYSRAMRAAGLPFSDLIQVYPRHPNTIILTRYPAFSVTRLETTKPFNHVVISFNHYIMGKYLFLVLFDFSDFF